MSCNQAKRSPQMVRIPHFERAWQVVPDCAHYNAEDVGTVMVAFYVMWKIEFGDEEQKLWKALNVLLIDWGQQLRPIKHAYDVEGTRVSQGRARGLTLTKSSIWVWISDTGRISGTSLVHELVHIALRAHGDHGDPDHEGDKYAGWTPDHTRFIKKINSILRSFNL